MKAFLREAPLQSITIIGYYGQPSMQKETLAHLQLFVENMQKENPNDYLMIAGDFNLRVPAM